MTRGTVLQSSRNNLRYILLSKKENEFTVIVCDKDGRSKNMLWTTKSIDFFSEAPSMHQMEFLYWRAGGKFNQELYLKYLEAKCKANLTTA